MDYRNETLQTWNKLANLYEEKFMDLPIYNGSYDSFCASIPIQQARILDIGCGPGNISRYLLKKRPDFQILGIDASPNMVALAKKNNPGARFQTMDVQDLNQLPGQFDGIISGFIIPYLSPSESAEFMQHCINLLVPGGVFYLSFVEGNPDQSGFQVGSSGDRCFFYYHQKEALENQLSTHFQNLQNFSVAYQKSNGDSEWHTILMATKK